MKVIINFMLSGFAIVATVISPALAFSLKDASFDDNANLVDTGSKFVARGGATGSAKGPVEQLVPFVDQKTTPFLNLSAQNQLNTVGVSGGTDAYQKLYTDFVSSSTTRYVKNAPEIKKAEQFIVDQFTALGLKVSKQPFTIKLGGKPVPCENVVADLITDDAPTGTTSFLKSASKSASTKPTIVVGAHYDSIPPSGPAPGADDNASGVVAMLTVAKSIVEAMKGRSGVKYNVRFVAFSAEEEGLWGSRHFVNVLQAAAKAKPEENKVYEVLTMDQVGFKKNRGDGVVNAIFETVGKKEGNQHLVDVLGRTAQQLFMKGKTDLSVNYHGFGSDHIPFLDAGYPSVLFIERDNLFYADKFGHTKYDKLENIDFDYARKMAEVAANSVLTLLLE